MITVNLASACRDCRQLAVRNAQKCFPFAKLRLENAPLVTIGLSGTLEMPHICHDYQRHSSRARVTFASW